LAKRSKAEAVASKALTAASLADDGAAIGSLFGPTGAGIGGVLGGITGLIIGDQTTIFPLDMVAIPAYQAYMIQGVPSMQIYIKEGEVLTQVTETAAQETMLAMESASPKKRRKANPWIKFSKGFDYRNRKKNESAKAYLSARSAAASRAYKKLKKGTGTKKGQVRKTARRAYMKK